ncbi:MAG: hypothetical protein IKA20_06275 [Clostridia bacterium]|nr:hypothetical protein [Clostridia bacterium]
MSQQYPASWKQCATCAYWMGARETNRFGEWVKVESYSTRGKCMCRGSGWTNMEKQANASCSHFEKWPVLK